MGKAPWDTWWVLLEVNKPRENIISTGAIADGGTLVVSWLTSYQQENAICTQTLEVILRKALKLKLAVQSFDTLEQTVGQSRG
jgi:hypothetical protein